MQNMTHKTILITGAAGFIGANVALRLLKKGEPVNLIGIDNLSEYYDVSIKKYRLHLLDNAAGESEAHWQFIKGSIVDKSLIHTIFQEYRPDIVINLAAQAGVRYSITNPDAYIETNLLGFYNILQACRHSYDGRTPGVQHLIYASSSSVYGSNKKVPYAIEDKTDNPVSLYAATKKSNVCPWMYHFSLCPASAFPMLVRTLGSDIQQSRILMPHSRQRSTTCFTSASLCRSSHSPPRPISLTRSPVLPKIR